MMSQIPITYDVTKEQLRTPEPPQESQSIQKTVAETKAREEARSLDTSPWWSYTRNIGYTLSPATRWFSSLTWGFFSDHTDYYSPNTAEVWYKEHQRELDGFGISFEDLQRKLPDNPSMSDAADAVDSVLLERHSQVLSQTIHPIGQLTAGLVGGGLGIASDPVTYIASEALLPKRVLDGLKEFAQGARAFGKAKATLEFAGRSAAIGAIQQGIADLTTYSNLSGDNPNFYNDLQTAAVSGGIFGGLIGAFRHFPTNRIAPEVKTGIDAVAQAVSEPTPEAVAHATRQEVAQEIPLDTSAKTKVTRGRGASTAARNEATAYGINIEEIPANSNGNITVKMVRDYAEKLSRPETKNQEIANAIAESLKVDPEQTNAAKEGRVPTNQDIIDKAVYDGNRTDAQNLREISGSPYSIIADSLENKPVQDKPDLTVEFFLDAHTETYKGELNKLQKAKITPDTKDRIDRLQKKITYLEKQKIDLKKVNVIQLKKDLSNFDNLRIADGAVGPILETNPELKPHLDYAKQIKGNQELFNQLRLLHGSDDAVVESMLGDIGKDPQYWNNIYNSNKYNLIEVGRMKSIKSPIIRDAYRRVLDLIRADLREAIANRVEFLSTEKAKSKYNIDLGLDDAGIAAKDRLDVRRISEGLDEFIRREAAANQDSVVILGKTAGPDDLFHELGHFLFPVIFSSAERLKIRNVFRSALEEGQALFEAYRRSGKQLDYDKLNVAQKIYDTYGKERSYNLVDEYGNINPIESIPETALDRLAEEYVLALTKDGRGLSDLSQPSRRWYRKLWDSLTYAFLSADRKLEKVFSDFVDRIRSESPYTRVEPIQHEILSRHLSSKVAKSLGLSVDELKDFPNLQKRLVVEENSPEATKHIWRTILDINEGKDIAYLSLYDDFRDIFLDKNKKIHLVGKEAINQLPNLEAIKSKKNLYEATPEQLKTFVKKGWLGIADYWGRSVGGLMFKESPLNEIANLAPTRDFEQFANAITDQGLLIKGTSLTEGGVLPADIRANLVIQQAKVLEDKVNLLSKQYALEQGYTKSTPEKILSVLTGKNIENAKIRQEFNIEVRRIIEGYQETSTSKAVNDAVALLKPWLKQQERVLKQGGMITKSLKNFFPHTWDHHEIRVRPNEFKAILKADMEARAAQMEKPPTPEQILEAVEDTTQHLMKYGGSGLVPDFLRAKVLGKGYGNRTILMTEIEPFLQSGFLRADLGAGVVGYARNVVAAAHMNMAVSEQFGGSYAAWKAHENPQVTFFPSLEARQEALKKLNSYKAKIRYAAKKAKVSKDIIESALPEEQQKELAFLRANRGKMGTNALYKEYFDENLAESIKLRQAEMVAKGATKDELKQFEIDTNSALNSMRQVINRQVNTVIQPYTNPIGALIFDILNNFVDSTRLTKTVLNEPAEGAKILSPLFRLDGTRKLAVEVIADMADFFSTASKEELQNLHDFTTLPRKALIRGEHQALEALTTGAAERVPNTAFGSGLKRIHRLSESTRTASFNLQGMPWTSEHWRSAAYLEGESQILGNLDKLISDTGDLEPGLRRLQRDGYNSEVAKTIQEYIIDRPEAKSKAYSKRVDIAKMYSDAEAAYAAGDYAKGRRLNNAALTHLGALRSHIDLVYLQPNAATLPKYLEGSLLGRVAGKWRGWSSTVVQKINQGAWQYGDKALFEYYTGNLFWSAVGTLALMATSGELGDPDKLDELATADGAFGFISKAWNRGDFGASLAGMIQNVYLYGSDIFTPALPAFYSQVFGQVFGNAKAAARSVFGDTTDPRFDFTKPDGWQNIIKAWNLVPLVNLPWIDSVVSTGLEMKAAEQRLNATNSSISP